MSPRIALRRALFFAVTGLVAGTVCAQTAPAPEASAETADATSPAASPTTIADTAAIAPAEARGSGGTFGSPYGRRSGTGLSGGGALPAAYDLLNRKSIFARDRMPRAERSYGSGSGATVRVRPAPVLVGVIREDDGFVAYLEDPDSGHFTGYRMGDRIPGNAGTFSAITLEGVDIAVASGQPPTHIGIGQNLLGVVPVRTAETSPAASDAGGSADSTTTAPAGNGPESVVERLKRLRRESLNK